jgi:PAS domain S-box-containing protein
MQNFDTLSRKTLTAGDEESRLVALDSLRILDSAPEQSYDDIVRLAASICGTPISTVTLVARDRQWFKARLGIEDAETPLDRSFCRYALYESGVMTVEDATKDERFANFATVTDEPKIRFYAGAKLVTDDGLPVGVLCVIDKVSRTLTEAQTLALEALARQTMALLELRRRNEELASLTEKHSRALARIEEQLQEIRNEEEQRRWADMLRRDSEMRLQSIIKSANDGIFLADDEHGMILWNEAAQAMFKYTDKQVRGRHFNMLVREASQIDLAAFVSSLGNQASQNTRKLIELQGVKADGSEFPVELSISLWKYEDTTFYTGIMRDITERKRIEDVKDEFVSTVSHELRTPLTSIRGALDLIMGGMAGPLSDDNKRLTGIALQSTERLVRLINDILDSEKIASGKAEFNIRAVTLSEVVLAAITEVRSFADQFEVSLEFEDARPKTVVMADADRIIQVLNNLLSNAVKASTKGGRVKARISDSDGKVRVEVVDKGTGIPLEFQPIIFERFSQAKSSGDKRKKTGTGLGLNIARSIVEKHHGTMDFHSVPGEGTVFYFDLPVVSQTEIK